MACICNQYNACSDWLTQGHYHPVMSTSGLQAIRDTEKSHVTNNLLTSNVCNFGLKGKSQTTPLLYWPHPRLKIGEYIETRIFV